ncbi:MAG: hypothetical protein RIQ51_142 [Bacteroidota bacterium]
MTALMKVYNPFKVNFTHGEGVYLYDDTNKRYLDCMAGIAVNAFGYNHPIMVQALTEQLQKLKKDREDLEQNLEKTRAQKIQELEKIDRALEEKKAEKNGVKQNSSDIKKKQQIAIQTPSGLNKVAAVAKKAEELHLLVQRFTY